jgi:hypothetical protein
MPCIWNKFVIQIVISWVDGRLVTRPCCVMKHMSFCGLATCEKSQILIIVN